MNLCRFVVDNKGRQREKGYILLVLLLFLALLSISFLTMAQRMDFEIKRDREEEMIHRGVQYSRAVRNFINKFHRYPNSIEELENTNNLRFLRKRYKDPITGKDFKILHLTDMPSFIPMPAPGVSVTGLGPQQGSRVAGSAASISTDITATGVAEAQSSSDAQSSSQGDQNSFNVAASPAASPSPSPQQDQAEVARAAGGIVVGVASVSRKKTIRVFNKKDHYDQWLFIYDPTTDRGGILNAPSQPPLQAVLQRNQQMNEQASPLGSASTPPGLTNPPTAISPTQTQQ